MPREAANFTGAFFDPYEKKGNGGTMKCQVIKLSRNIKNICGEMNTAGFFNYLKSM